MAFLFGSIVQRKPADSRCLSIKESRIGMVYCPYFIVQCNSHCGVNFVEYTRVVRLSPCSALLMGVSLPQNHNGTIVCSIATLCKTRRGIIVFPRKSLVSVLFACFCVQRKTLRGLKNDVYTRVVCLLRSVHLALWFLPSKL